MGDVLFADLPGRRTGVSAINRQAGDDLDQRLAELVHREVADPPVPIRNIQQRPEQAIDLGAQEAAQDQAVLGADHGRVIRGFAGEFAIETSERLLASRIHEESGRAGHEIVAGGSGNRPGGWQVFPVFEDFLHHNPRASHRGAEALEVLLRIA